MYKIEQTDDCVIIEYNGVKRTYPKKGVDNFLISYALDREGKLQVATKQYNSLLKQYNALVQVANGHRIIDFDYWKKIDSEEL